MSFAEWIGNIAITIFFTYIFGAIGFLAATLRGGGIESIPGLLLAACIAAVVGFLGSLKWVWGVDILPFL